MFVVDNSIKMEPNAEQTEETLKMIFDDFLNPKD